MTHAEIRALFWHMHPDLPRRRYRYCWGQDHRQSILVYPVDTRCAFVDFIDALHRAGEITDKTADRITL